MSAYTHSNDASDGAAGAPLVFQGDKSAPAAHEPGCYRLGGAFVYPDGRAFGLRSKASNRCPGCARAVAFENMTMLRQDAEEGHPPSHVLTLTSREPVTDAGAYRQACSSFWRAFRRRWGHVEYCGFIEWTTGDAPRSGGHRRLHSHWLIKDVTGSLASSGVSLAAIEAWASAEWRKLTGAWVVQLAELRTVGGVVGYLALHHEKLSQAPPPGWTGRRLRPSRGYFQRSGRERRERAVAWLQEHRLRSEGADDGALLARSHVKPRVVFGRTERERASADLLATPGRSFDSLPARQALDAQLRRAAALRAAESDEDRYRRVHAEGLTTLALRRRAEFRRYRADGPPGVGGRPVAGEFP